MNLDGMSLIILGAPVPEAEVIRHADLKKGIYREIFHRDGRILGGVLVGDISSAGVLHSMINTGRKATGDEDLLKPSVRAFRRISLGHAPQKRRIRYI
jgi:NAD(P)H-nitrite reductase large subunit